MGGGGVAKKYRTLMAQKFDAFVFNPLPKLQPAVWIYFVGVLFSC